MMLGALGGLRAAPDRRRTRDRRRVATRSCRLLVMGGLILRDFAGHLIAGCRSTASFFRPERKPMQGKIAVEEHFAIPTDQRPMRYPDGVLVGAAAQASRLSRSRGSPRWMLTASRWRCCRSTPTGSGHFRCREGRRARPQGERRAGRDYRQAAGPLRRTRRAADAGSRRRDRGAEALRRRDSISRAFWSTVFRRSARPTARSITTAAILAVLGGGRAAGRAVLSASTRPVAKPPAGL